MFRRISMAAGIFLTLFLAVMLYQHFSDDARFGATTSDGGAHRPTYRVTGGPMDAPTGTKPYIEKTDDEGRIVSIYEAESWRKLAPTTYHLIKPHIRYFRADGQRVDIVASEGVLQTSNVGGKLQVRRGTLEGKVRRYKDGDIQEYVEIVIDRWVDKKHPGETRTDIADRPVERVKIYALEMDFDDEDMAIQADGRICLFSHEADIIGTGLTIQWNVWEGKIGELRKFRLERGEYMAIYESDDLPDPSSRPSPSSAKPAPIVAAPSQTPRTATPPPPAIEAARNTQPTNIPEPRNVYSATFEKNVRMHQGNKSMLNVDKLTLRFNWDMDAQRSPEPAPKPVTHRASTSSSVATTVPEAGPAGAAPSDRATTRQAAPPSTQPVKKIEPIFIFWDGPLDMHPVKGPGGHTDHPEIRNNRIEAEGKRIVWSEPKTAAICQRFTLRKSDDAKNPQDIITLSGSPDRPALLAQADGELITSEKITFDRVKMIARMEGAGYILRPGKDEEPEAPEKVLALAQIGIVPGGDRISWKKRVDAVLGEEAPTDPDDEERLFISEARFDHVSEGDEGRVELVQAKGGDFVWADKLYVRLGREVGPGGKKRSYPVLAKASGRVVAKQAGADIEAENLDVEFARSITTASAPVKKTDDSLAIEPSFMWARGNVHVTDIDEKGEKLEIFADDLKVYPQEGTATLLGNIGEKKMARIIQGEGRLRGYDIRLNKPQQSLAVKGAGNMRFKMDKNLDGKVLDKPRPMDVSWRGRMDFRGEKNEAIFSENVSLRSDTDTLKSGYMILTFEEEATSQPASQPSGRSDAKRRLGMEVNDISKRKLATMTCTDDVVLARTVLDAGKKVLQSMELKSGNLTYNAKNGDMRVTGPGSMVSADYKMSAPTAAEKSAELTMAQTPRQTAFVWQKSMLLTDRVNGGRKVELDGGVQMRHRSGDKILSVKGAGPMANLPAGRKTALDCDHILALFAPKVKKTSTSHQTTTAPADATAATDLGELEQFIATGNVDLEDGPQRLVGYRLNYIRGNKVIIEGGKGTDAQVVFRPSPGAMPKTVRSPRIECYFNNKGRIIRVEFKGMVGGG